MAGKLVQVDSVTVTSPVASIYLTGINDDSVYMCVVSNASNNSGDYQLRMRVAVDSVQKSTGNYDYAYKQLDSTTTFFNSAVTNANMFGGSTTGTSANEVQNYIFYFYNWYSSSEYSFWTNEEVTYNSTPKLIGATGGGVYTVGESHNSVRFWTGNSVSNEYDTTQGTFTLYRVV